MHASSTDTTHHHHHPAPTSPARTPVSDQPLRRDVRMLGFELGRVIKQHGQPGAFDLIERIRMLAKRRRAEDDGADRALRDLIADLDLDQIDACIRALSCFFDLANLAEDRHRVRVLRQRELDRHPGPRGESIGAAIDTLHAQHLSADDVQSLLDSLDIELVFTAHPTEAKRRTVRNTLRRLRQDVIDMDRQELLPRERDWLLRRVKTDLACLWETDALRPRRPTVLEEVQRSMFVADSVWDTLPRLFRSLRQALARVYPEHTFRIPTFMRFGSWIGGDRDGNPFVTPEVTRRTLTMLRSTALSKHIEQCDRLRTVLTISRQHHPLSPQLEQALRDAQERWPELREIVEQINPHEAYRHWMKIVRTRLEHTAQADPFADPPRLAYAQPDELHRDLSLVAESLRANGHDTLADGELQDWLDRVAVFGFRLARLDIREDAHKLRAVVNELMRALGLADDFDALDEQGKQRLLAMPVDASALTESSLSEEAQQTLELFVLIDRTLAHFDAQALGNFVISMTRQPSDALAVLWLHHVAGARRGADDTPTGLPIVPLFETIDDLERAADILDGLLRTPAYTDHVLATGNLQTCMVGYSDSTKDGGTFAANWWLYQAQRDLADVADRHGVKLMCFHGRGGALGRGGGPAARGIRSLPPQSVRGKLRMTEQGEVLAERYDDPEIAHRHLEQVTWATMLVSAQPHAAPNDAWDAAMKRAADASMRKYRELITDDGFINYFEQATPIDSIETLPIGSRPARRRGQRQLSALRAIPYTFAWTQSRHMITAFFGIGTGLHAAAGEDWTLLRTMYADWPFFRAVIDNAELALAKCDMSIAKAYADLVDDEAVGARLWQLIHDEYERSRDTVLRITQRSALLEGTPWLQSSIRVRNPYIDPLNFIQGELMRRLRAAGDGDDGECERLRELLRHSVQGVSAGMRTTG